MAHSTSFNTPSSSHSIASPAGSPSTATATASFSIFQEGPGQILVFAPPRGTPELQALVDLFIALDIPASMKMDMIQRDFEAHAARTNERYKTYFVSGAATPAASASPAALATAATPADFTVSPNPLFNGSFIDFGLGGQQTSGSGSGTGSGSTPGSGSGSAYLDGSPAARSSPTGSDLAPASDALVPFDMSMYPQFNALVADQPFDMNSYIANASFFPMTAMADQNQSMTMASATTADASSTWPATLPTATSPSDILASSRTQLVQRASQSRRSQDHRQHRQHRPSAQPQRRQLTSSSSSMQIITRTGEDVTHMSSRATRSHEERENTRLVRQRGACPDCRRKKTRCNPEHTGSTLDRVVSRPTPYTSPVLSGRARHETAAALAAKAAQEKKSGKQAVTTSDPVFTIPPSIDMAILSGVEGGGTIPTDHRDDFGLGVFADPIDWNQLSGQDLLFSSDDLDLDIVATLSMTTPSTHTTATASSSAPSSQAHQNGAGLAHTGECGVLPCRPMDPPRSATCEHKSNHLNTTDTGLTLSHTEMLSPHQLGAAGTIPAPSLPALFTNRSQSSAGNLVAGSRDFCALPDTDTESISRAEHVTNSSGGSSSSNCVGSSDSSSDATTPLSESSVPAEHAHGPGCQSGGHETPVSELGESSPASDSETEPCRTEPAWTRRHSAPLAECDVESQTQTQPQSPSQSERGVSTSQTPQGTPSMSEETLAVVAGLTELAHSLIPAYIAWTATQSLDVLADGPVEGMERLRISPAMVACQ